MRGCELHLQRSCTKALYEPYGAVASEKVAHSPVVVHCSGPWMRHNSCTTVQMRAPDLLSLRALRCTAKRPRRTCSRQINTISVAFLHPREYNVEQVQQHILGKY